MSILTFMVDKELHKDILSSIKDIFNLNKKEVRIMIRSDYSNYLTVCRIIKNSEVYPELELYSLEYYDDKGDYDGETLYQSYGIEYFSLLDDENLYKALLKRLTHTEPKKESGFGFSKIDCVSAHHMTNIKNKK